MNVLQQNKRRRIMLGEDNNALIWLVIINTVVFAMLAFIKVIYLMSYDKELTALQFFHSQISQWFTLSGNFSTAITRPWTVLTYMFTHESVMLLLSNMLWLWCFGYILQDLSGNSKLIPLYLYGGFAGAVLFLLSVNIIPVFSNAASNTYIFSGAGAAVMAVAIAATTLSPAYKIFPMISGGIPLWVLTLIFVAVDFVSIGSGNAPVGIAHLASGLVGFIFIKELKKGNDFSKWMNDLANWFDNLFNPEKKNVQQPKQEIFYKASRKPFEKRPHFSQQKLDEILDKINDEGYDLLSEEEKDFLNKASKEDL